MVQKWIMKSSGRQNQNKSLKTIHTLIYPKISKLKTLGYPFYLEMRALYFLPKKDSF